ncbi:MAG: NAD(P)-dependent alcohol dehydrogenase [Anaerolineae bacterium]
MQALVLEKTKTLSLRDIDIEETLGPHDVRIAIRNVGICGSDVHYYQHGRIGPFVVEEPMVLGHEASGTVIEVGDEVTNLKVGDRVCMEPGIPDPNSRATRLGMYNLDPAVRFWATPPVHGVLRPTVVHPANFTFKLPDNVSFAEGAMVEPLAIGMHAANKAQIRPGDLAVVTGAGTIGVVTALAALAGGCSQVVISDVLQPKLDLVATLGPILPVNVTREDLTQVVQDLTEGWGADIVFEASGNAQAASRVFEPLCPGGRVVFIGMPGEPIPYDVVAAQVKEARVEHIFRYAHVYPRALALMGSGKIDLKPLITDIFEFKDSIKAFDYATRLPPTSVKAQIELPQ